jgi:hypothetical protein
MDNSQFNWDIPIFSCFNSPITSINDAPDLHCLLINMIPELIKPFKDAKIPKKLTKKLLMTFLFDLHRDIYELLWKARSLFLKRPKHQHKRQRRNNYDSTSNNPII